MLARAFSGSSRANLSSGRYLVAQQAQRAVPKRLLRSDSGVAHWRVPCLPTTPKARFFTAGGNHDEVQNAIDSHNVVVFYSPTCPFCAMAIDALNQAEVDHKLVLINAEYKAGLIERIRKGSVPSVWVKGEYIGGCNDGIAPGQGVLPMLKSGKLQEMLKA
mmetsp:Transcript_51992/g.123777  ORF Transcript_51992/g.123777 Transcript_51992/m.123777 type:complete len:161 (+) Transcript_51992:46-528(+)